MEALITLANLIYVLAYFVQDLMRLRLLTIVAASILAGYFWLRPEPIMAVVYWNSFFILLNLAQVLRILCRRRTCNDRIRRAAAAVGSRFRRLCPRRARGSSRCAAI